MRFFIVTLTIFLFGCNFSSGKDTEVINLPQGDLVGFTDGDTDYFLGIPYAEPPIGANRFEPPKSHKGWKNVLDANEACLLYTSPSPRDATLSRMPSSA